MSRRRMFLDVNVADAARLRIRHVYDTFDTVAIQFSGGKDSTAVLYLAKEIHEERGLGPVKVIFRDEEMVSPSTVSYIEEVKNYPWVDMEWFCLPRGSEMWVLGKRQYILLWSAKRARAGRLVRPIPDWAIRAEHFGLDYEQTIPMSIDYYTMQGKQGKVAFITGVRANESMIRYRSVVQKLHENYINKPFKMSKAVPLRFAKIIYDWETNDVLKFIHESGGRYSEYYDYAAMSGANTRVGVPLNSVASRRINDVVMTEPEFYDRLVECFPSIDAQRRLWRDFDMEALIEHYAEKGWNGVRDCIEQNMLTPGLRRSAMRFSSDYRKKHAADAYSYPIDNLIRQILLREFHHTSPNPVGPKTRAHAIRLAANADADSLDMSDDFV